MKAPESFGKEYFGGADFGFDFSSANSSVGHVWLAHGLLEIRETKDM